MTNNSLHIEGRFSSSFNVVNNIFLDDEIIKCYVDRFLKSFHDYEILFLDIVLVDTQTHSLEIKKFRHILY